MADKPLPLGQEGYRAKNRGHYPWIRNHVWPERRYTPPGGPGFCRRRLRRARKSTAQRHYQLLSGHAAIGSFLHDRMTGPQRLETDERWWCNCGRQSRYHLSAECQAWAPQIRDLWRKIGKDCHWEHPRAPALRWLWKEEATESVLEFLESTRVVCRASAEVARARVDEDRGGGAARGAEGEEGGPGPP